MDLYDVRWRQRDQGRVEQCSQFVLASSKQAACETVYEIEDVRPLKRYPPHARRIDSEEAARALCGKYWRPGSMYVVDARENGACGGQFLSDLLPELRERWRFLASEAEANRLQIKMRFARA